ncbi:unnamed protein product, partial [Musa hybrid cultivar]
EELGRPRDLNRSGGVLQLSTCDSKFASCILFGVGPSRVISFFPLSD